MQQDDVLLADDVVARHAASGEADGDRELATGTVLYLLDDIRLVGAVEKGGKAGVAFIHGLHQHVAVATVDQPVGEVVHRGELVDDLAFLAVVEELDHHNDAVRVSGPDHLVEARHPRRLQRTIGIDGAHEPGVVTARAGERRRRVRRAAALEADRDHPDPVLRVGRQHGQELVHVPLRVPQVRIGVDPITDRGGVVVVEDRLGHAGIEQLAFGRLSRRGQLTIDQEPGAVHRDHGLRCGDDGAADARLKSDGDGRG